VEIVNIEKHLILQARQLPEKVLCDIEKVCSATQRQKWYGETRALKNIAKHNLEFSEKMFRPSDGTQKDKVSGER
jgi:hypothetical protein